MMHPRRLILVGLCLAATSAAAQHSPTELLEQERDRRSFSTRSVGMSWHSPRASRWGRITDRHVYLLGIGREREIAFGGATTLLMTHEIPVAVVERVPGERQYCYLVDGVCLADRGVKLSVGVGIMPVGLKWAWHHREHARLFASAAAGVLAFNSEMPVERSRKRNFALEAGVGIEREVSGGAALTIGYKFHHLSNAGTGEANPGLDANVVYLSMSRLRTAKR